MIIKGKGEQGLFIGSSDIRSQRMEGAGSSQNAKKQSNGRSIFAGDLRIPQDKIALKRQELRKKAMKAVRAAHTGEMKIDGSIEELRTKSRQQQESIEENHEIVKQIEEQKSQLKASMGIEDDSQEQKDLELLERERASRRPDSDVRLTNEEKARLEEMGPLTEYQGRAMELNEAKDDFEKEIEASRKIIRGNNAAISSISIERLKSHEMADAQAEKTEIERNGAKELAGMLMAEGQEHLEELAKEAQEKMERLQKEKAEEEKKEAERKEKETEQEARTEQSTGSQASAEQTGVLPGNADQQELQKMIKNFIDTQQMLEEDLKGVVVNQQF